MWWRRMSHGRVWVEWGETTGETGRVEERKVRPWGSSGDDSCQDVDGQRDDRSCRNPEEGV